MTIKQFIEKAIEGGWEETVFHPHGKKPINVDWGTGRHKNDLYACGEGFWDNPIKINIDGIFLDPKSWQAVGKVEGWDNGKHIDKTYKNAPPTMSMWQWKMHAMIDALIDGKTIEEFIETL